MKKKNYFSEKPCDTVKKNLVILNLRTVDNKGVVIPTFYLPPKFEFKKRMEQHQERKRKLLNS